MLLGTSTLLLKEKELLDVKAEVHFVMDRSLDEADSFGFV